MAEAGDTGTKEQPTLQSLFGDHVVKGDMLDRIEIDDLGGEGKVVGVYLSGHWCPPCKLFTPVLAEWYDRFKEGPNADNLEIIFVSSDKSEIEFMQYYMTMPWAALPYAERERKTAITSLFNIGGIPALIFINGATCELISDDGRSIVTEDVNGEDFPWVPMPIMELLAGDIVKCTGRTVEDLSAVAGNTIGLLFAAQWCPPCQTFLPQLTAVYDTLKAKGEKFEIIFISSDRTQEAYEEFSKDMTWYSLPYDDRRIKKLFRIQKIDAVPAVITIGADGKIINDSARTAIEQDPTGKSFPWYPKPVMELDDDSVEQINEFPCVVWLSASDRDALDNARFVLEPVSEAYHKTVENKEQAKKAKTLIQFYFGGASVEDDVGEQLRMFADLPQQLPLLAILDIPNQSKYICDKKKLTKQVVSDFLKGYQQGKLPRQEMDV